MKIKDYKKELIRSIDKINVSDIIKAANLIESSNRVYICGNGGSAAIANHFAIDLNKSTASCHQVTSLAANPSVITAIANDISYDDVFSEQLDYYGSLETLQFETLIVVSSSGNSKNIIKALELAQDRRMNTIVLSGFDYVNRINGTGDVNFHVNSYNYGVVEDTHHAILHMITERLK
jgi:D-sedoheptulose 7-phosphate isomerase